MEREMKGGRGRLGEREFYTHLRRENRVTMMQNADSKKTWGQTEERNSWFG